MKVSLDVFLASFPTCFPNSPETVSGCYTLLLSSFCCKAALFEVCLRGDVGQLPDNPIRVLLLFLFCCPRSPSCSLSLRLAWLGFLPPWVGAPFGAPCGPPFGLWAPVLVRGYTGIFCQFTAALPSLFLPPGLAEPKLVWLKPLVGKLRCRALVLGKTW